MNSYYTLSYEFILIIRDMNSYSYVTVDPQHKNNITAVSERGAATSAAAATAAGGATVGAAVSERGAATSAAAATAAGGGATVGASSASSAAAATAEGGATVRAALVERQAEGCATVRAPALVERRRMGLPPTAGSVADTDSEGGVFLAMTDI